MRTKLYLGVIGLLLICTTNKSYCQDALSAKDDKYSMFYQTWDSVIHEVSSLKKNKYFSPFGGDYMVIDGEKISKLDIKAFQNEKAYYANTFGKTDKKIHGISASIFAERLIKGKINMYYNIAAVTTQGGSRGDYYFQVGDNEGLMPLRSYQLKTYVADCKQCKVLMNEAEAEYNSLSSSRQMSADNYLSSEKKLVKALIAVINQYNSH